MIADKNIRELENSSVELTVTVPAKEVEQAYQETLKKYAAQVQIKGFRKGKAPVTVLESKFGTAIREESTFGVLEDAVKEAIDSLEEKYRPLPYSTPALQDEDELLPFKEQTDLVFKVVYDVIPEFELPAYTGLVAEVPKVKITDALVMKEIDKLRDQNALVIEKQGPAADGDIVTIDYAELDKDGKEVAGTARKDFVFTIGTGYNFYKIDEDVTGMSKGDEKRFDKTYPADYEINEYAGKTITLTVSMKQVKKREVPVLDDEFAQDIKEEYKTVADLKKATKEKLEESLKGKMEETKLSALFDLILEKTAIPVPASMIEFELENTWNKFTRQSGMPEDQILKFLEFQGQSKDSVLEEWKEGASKTIRTQLLMDKIKDKEQVPVDEKELDEAVAEQLSSIEDADQKAYYRSLIEDDMRFRKTGDFLLENNKYKEGKEVDFDTFMSGTPEEA